MSTYHENAQNFIKGSKAMGYGVKREGSELIAYPPGTPKKTSLKSKIVDVASDIMSYPARRKAQKQVLQSNNDLADVKMLRQARQNGITENDIAANRDWHDPLFRARANVMRLRANRTNK